jgi:hypothetical protein
LEQPGEQARPSPKLSHAQAVVFRPIQRWTVRLIP